MATVYSFSRVWPRYVQSRLGCDEKQRAVSSVPAGSNVMPEGAPKAAGEGINNTVPVHSDNFGTAANLEQIVNKPEAKRVGFYTGRLDEVSPVGHFQAMPQFSKPSLLKRSKTTLGGY